MQGMHGLPAGSPQPGGSQPQSHTSWEFLDRRLSLQPALDPYQSSRHVNYGTSCMDGQEHGEDMELFSWDRVVVALGIPIVLVFPVDETRDITGCVLFRGVVKIFISLQLKVFKLSCIHSVSIPAFCGPLPSLLY